MSAGRAKESGPELVSKTTRETGASQEASLILTSMFLDHVSSVLVLS